MTIGFFTLNISHRPHLSTVGTTHFARQSGKYGTRATTWTKASTTCCTSERGSWLPIREFGGAGRVGSSGEPEEGELELGVVADSVELCTECWAIRREVAGKVGEVASADGLSVLELEDVEGLNLCKGKDFFGKKQNHIKRILLEKCKA